MLMKTLNLKQNHAISSQVKKSDHPCMLASDFDGTLSQDHIRVSSNDVSAIQLFSMNHIFGIISGRTFLSLQAICKQNHIPYDFLGCFNGGLIIDNRGNCLYERPITQDVTSLLETLKSTDAVTFHVVGKNQVLLGYQANVDSSIKAFERGLYADFEKITRLENIDEIFIITCEFKNVNTALQYVDYINAAYPFVHATANTHYIDIMEKDVSKLHAIQFLHNYYQIPKERTFTIGDSYNDLEMLKQFQGFAIQGNPDIMKACKHSVASVGEAIPICLQSNK